IEALSSGTPVAVATGSSLDDIAPPDSPRFSPVDSGILIRLMGTLSHAREDDPSIARQLTERYQLIAFFERVHAFAKGFQ
ncbi:glycosyltransferase family 1 protein, partial [Pseudomonas syringae pv. tagetis]